MTDLSHKLLMLEDIDAYFCELFKYIIQLKYKQVIMNLINRKSFNFFPKHSIISQLVWCISQAEARKIMQIPPEEGENLKEEYLKKQYLKLAKVYHPDA